MDSAYNPFYDPEKREKEKNVERLRRIAKELIQEGKRQNDHHLIRAAYTFIDGLDNRLPSEYYWKDAEERLRYLDDPEYRQYIKLKNKFEK